MKTLFKLAYDMAEPRGATPSQVTDLMGVIARALTLPNHADSGHLLTDEEVERAHTPGNAIAEWLDSELGPDVADRAERLRSAGFTVEPVSDVKAAAEARDNGRISPFDQGRYPGNGPLHVELSGIASGDDRTGQTSMVHRSNYRAIRRDFEDVAWVDVSYMDGDALGAFIEDLDDHHVDVFVGLAEQYPVYDEEDMSKLEDEEIQDSIEAYVNFDVGRHFDGDDDAEWWSDLSIPHQTELIRAAMAEGDLYPDHSGYEPLWQYDQLAKWLADARAGIDAQGNDASIPTGDRFDTLPQPAEGHAEHYPRKTEDGSTVWACCVSSIGPVCEHRADNA